MAATTRGRVICNNEVAIDQADFFQGDGFTRITGLAISQLTASIFFNNTILAWTLVQGATVQDAQVAAGHIYWHEIPGAPGFYSVRFRPNAVGYWRIVVMYAAGLQTLAQDFDVLRTGAQDGLTASFIKR